MDIFCLIRNNIFEVMGTIAKIAVFATVFFIGNGILIPILSLLPTTPLNIAFIIALGLIDVGSIVYFIHKLVQ